MVRISAVPCSRWSWTCSTTLTTSTPERHTASKPPSLHDRQIRPDSASISHPFEFVYKLERRMKPDNDHDTEFQT